MARDICVPSTCSEETDIYKNIVHRVIESKNPEWPVGTHMVHYEGWRTHALMTNQKLKEDKGLLPIQVMPEMGNLPQRLGLGILGMPG